MCGIAYKAIGSSPGVGLWIILFISYYPAVSLSATDDETDGIIEEVIVSARKRAESVMDIPLSVSFITGKKFENYGLNEPADLANFIPNFYMDKADTSVRVSVRGIGTSATNPSFDTSVGLAIDGVYFGRTRWFEMATFDIDQIEVLRGPQGVHFGKNVTAGLVNIRSKGPADTWSSRISVGKDNQLDETVYEASVGGYFNDNFGARLAVQNRDREGWLNNLDLKEKEPSLEQELVRITMNWTPIDNLEVTIKGQLMDQRRRGREIELDGCSEEFSLVLAANNSKDNCKLDGERTSGKGIDNGFVVMNDGEVNDNDSKSVSVDISWRVKSHTINYVLGWHDQIVDFNLDADFTDIRAFPIEIPEAFEQVSHELRLESAFSGRFQYLAGVYIDNAELYSEQNFDFDLQSLAPLELLPFDIGGVVALPDQASGSSFRRFVQPDDSWAVFGELGIDLTGATQLLLGGRYTEQKKSAKIDQELGSLGMPHDNDPASSAIFNEVFGWTEIHGGKGSRKSQVFSPSAVFQWDFSPTGRFYLSYKEAFKSGGFDGSVDRQEENGDLVRFEYDDEFVESLEAGVKTSLNDHRVSISAALYHTKYTNLQVQTVTGFNVDTLNAAESLNRGVELDVVWRPLASVSLNVGVAYSDARYEEFDVAPCYAGQTQEQGCREDETQNLAGERLPIAPKWSGAAGADWEVALGNVLKLNAGLNVSYRDEVILATDQDPKGVSNELVLVGAYFRISDLNKRYSLSISASNLFDEDYSRGFFDFVGFVGTFARVGGEPKSIMTKLTISF